MSVNDSKVIKKRIPGDGRDRGNGGRFKDLEVSNTSLILRIVSKQEILK
jgi:hypothetical protein